MSIFDKIMKTETKVEKMSCNCQAIAEKWLEEQEKEKNEESKEKSAK